MHSDDAKLTNSRSSSRYIEGTQRIFFELASDQRLSILFKLNRAAIGSRSIQPFKTCKAS